MNDLNNLLPERTVGLDLGDQSCALCVLDRAGEVIERSTLAMSPGALRDRLGALPPARVALEATTHSPWVSRLLTELGHDVVVANPVAAARLVDRSRKSDRRDAESLARTARLDPRLLQPVQHRSAAHQHDLAVIRARARLVQARTRLLHAVRGTAKAAGVPVAGLTSRSFGRRALEQITEPLRPALLPMLEAIEQIQQRIVELDRRVEYLARHHYPQTALLTQVRGVGALTALTFVLVLHDPDRFKARHVPAFLGLVPRQHQSGESDPQLSITKQGDRLLRTLLVQCAHYILGPFGTDCDLRRFGLRLIDRGGRGVRQRAAIAVARRLAVLLHALWRSGEVYTPLRASQQAA